VRAHPGAPVATPIGWHELDTEAKQPPIFSIEDVRERVSSGVDPWPDFDGAAARITKAMLRSVRV
jgi:bifunctional non-homologous end joining protein LigD